MGRALEQFKDIHVFREAAGDLAHLRNPLFKGVAQQHERYFTRLQITKHLPLEGHAVDHPTPKPVVLFRNE